MTAAQKVKPEPLTVSALTAQLRGLIEGRFASVWVAGEVSNFTRASSGHWYFTLKDAGAQLKAAMFRGFNLRMKFDPRDGTEVIARGRLSVYDPRGDYQLIVEEMQPKGIGAAELALRQLKEKLLAKGYFDPRRKRPLPRFPRRVGLIASLSGAAIRDMVELFAQRWPLTELVIRPSRVQGDGAAAEVAAAVRVLNHFHTTRQLPLHAIVIGRGGGSTEDLWAFNEEVVADAVFNSVVPVVSAVGHEIDVTVCDLVADHRAETPSAAVVALTPDRREMAAGLLELRTRLYESVDRRLELARQRVEQLAARPALRRPLQRVRDLEQRLDTVADRMQRAANARVGQTAAQLAALAARLETLSPLNVLTRGYSLTHTNDGKLVRDAAAVRPGDVLVTRVAAGTVVSRVESVEGS
ncbi:exodeoxyribonuclease vii large subunit : Exodeoxyribonuclease 7 large subunit OS=Planctomyces maris DSM 8797 GN=xseA PE=3 SV=1: tRNA_anti_2: Exonuc_VII_L [Gemmataceae bacterium]|nr:exodeoxyribonuclease vii large subunit : Exodeoxyribonuclease 7 large subunit OS=Planctomyces maris DSM 8797 GN=xseA PE=3 SV=1: tRNA_anti_2: Exonuc_VII_L [Gemmataceae bacterium]VTU02120.1 exodeoxyribonuclease vii large subunit : Exodeoxyribonuclease 7 large subunit OS=Planctomyces maris DSM 8797 GN=xseA PE=3 SV=1: tRNA_anti_2: Exonuc_VII_L [Gemmataceae bacterium]